jgi:hypothetical protein
MVAVLITGYSVTAQETKSSQVQATSLSAKAVAPKVDLLPGDFCEEKTIRQMPNSRRSRRGNLISYQCTEKDPSDWLVAPGKPGVRAGITADCEDDGQGKPTNCIWKCVKDDDSDCSGFIAMCVGEDGNVEGNKNGATCTP